MSIARSLALSTRPWARRGLVAVLTLAGALALAPARAQALGVEVAFPDVVTVGQTGLTAHLKLTNTATTQVQATVCNAGPCEKQTSEGIILIASCGSAATPTHTCSVPDPGVFAVASSAPVVAGSCGVSPLITSFDVTVVDAAQGKLRLAPVGATNVVLGLAGTPEATCDIPLTFSVAALPVADADPATEGRQTVQLAAADATLRSVTGATVVENGSGRDRTTVKPAGTPPPPGGPPPPQPPPALPPPPPPVVQPGGLDHFKCYEVVQPPNFRQRTVNTRDQFGQRRTRVVRTRQLCNPVSKDQGNVLRPRAHLVCYEARDQNPSFVQRTVLVTNQFGQRKLNVLRPNRLCVPSLKRKGTTGVPPSGTNPERVLDHFRCYDVKAQPATRTVTTRDQFLTAKTQVIQVVRLCNPVRKNATPVRNAKAHLVCYTIRDSTALRPLGVLVRNQFGRAALRVRRAETLCLPSFKEVMATTAPAAAPPGLDHFKCYVAEQPQFQPRVAILRDQFGLSDSQVVKVRQLCNPVSKNQGKVINKPAHLVCYETRDLGPVPFKPRDVRVSNQFGIRKLTAVTPVSLCVPSLKRKGAGAAPPGTNPEKVLDHFRCYDVKPQAAAKTVKLVDQFKTTKAKVLRVVRLCNPTAKDNTPIKRPRAHLVCYSISENPFQPLAATVRNQYGVGALRVRTPEMLCLPSFKQLVTAAGAVIAPANPG